MQLKYFSTYRMKAQYITVRAGSTYYDFGGTTHSVTGGFYHGNFSLKNYDYDVAVLRVCPDFDIAIGFSKYVMCL